MYSGTPVAAKALASSLVIAAEGGGLVLSCAGTIDASAPSATYYVQLIDSLSPVDTDGNIDPICAPIPVVHVLGVPDYFQFPIPVGGLSLKTGAVCQLSTTLTTGTLAGAYMLAGSAR
jgi:hypothetical protein